MEWKDTTSYSRYDKEHKQRWWTAQAATLRISVGNSHVYYPDGKTWLLHCEPWFNTHELKSKNSEDAKAEAIILVLKKLKDVVKALSD